MKLPHCGCVKYGWGQLRKKDTVRMIASQKTLKPMNERMIR